MGDGDKKGWFGNLPMFRRKETPPVTPPASLVAEIAKDFQPRKGTFFQTLEYPVLDAVNNVVGKNWMEAGYNTAMSSWVLWQKSIMRREDVLIGGEVNILSSKALFEKTDFITAFDQLVTFEAAQKTLGFTPLTEKTPMKLGGDYFRQFAWREGLIISRSGRLYPYREGDNVQASNFFDMDDLRNVKSFLERSRAEEYIPVPLSFPSTNWEKAYAADSTHIDTRLNVVRRRFQNERDSFDLAIQIVSHEAPEILWAHLQSGFVPGIFHADPKKHFALVKAAIDRDDVEAIDLLSHAGLSFFVRAEGNTPVRHALQQRRYSHLHIMTTRDGAALANYPSEDGSCPAFDAMTLQDRQAFHQLYLAGLDYSYADPKGWRLIHHAFDQSFMPGIYAWLGENLTIDETIRGTSYTGLSIARQKDNQPLVAFAIEHGANASAPVMEVTTDDRKTTEAATPSAQSNNETQLPFAQGVIAAIDTIDTEKTRTALIAQLHDMVAGKAINDLVDELTTLGQQRQQSAEFAAKTNKFMRAAGEELLPSRHNFIFHLLNSDIPNQDVERILTAYTSAGGLLDLVDQNAEPLWEVCWKNQKTTPEFNRRALIPMFHKLGADPSALLNNGTTQLVRAASGTVFDLDFFKTLAPYVGDPNQPDVHGNNVLHALQLNSSEQVGRSGNFDAVYKLFPSLNLNRQNKDGYSNIGLAIRLDRSQTLKLLLPQYPADLSQITASGWSYHDIAFTQACKQAKVMGAPRADRITSISDSVREYLLDAMDQTASDDRLRQTLNRIRPDSKTLLTAMIDDEVPASTIRHMLKNGMVSDQVDGHGVDPRQQAFQSKRVDLITLLNPGGQALNVDPEKTSSATVISMPLRRNPNQETLPDGAAPEP